MLISFRRKLRKRENIQIDKISTESYGNWGESRVQGRRDTGKISWRKKPLCSYTQNKQFLTQNYKSCVVVSSDPPYTVNLHYCQNDTPFSCNFEWITIPEETLMQTVFLHYWGQRISTQHMMMTLILKAHQMKHHFEKNLSLHRVETNLSATGLDSSWAKETDEFFPLLTVSSGNGMWV